GDCGLQRLLGRRSIGRVALQEDVAADAVHLRFIPTLGVLQLGERVVQALEPGISLAGTRFGFGQGRSETGQEPNGTLLLIDGEAASHLGESRLFGTVGPLCPTFKKHLPSRSKMLGDRIETRYRQTLGCRSRLLRGYTAETPAAPQM